MCDDGVDERVLDRLDEVQQTGGGTTMYTALVVDSWSLDDLSYADWVEALEATGSEVCIEVVSRSPKEAHTLRYVALYPPGQLMTHTHHDYPPLRAVSVRTMVKWYRADRYELAPVPVEETPFEYDRDLQGFVPEGEDG